MASVLYVDDDEAVGRVISRQLSSRGHEVRVASSIAAAQRSVSGSRFDGVLVDIWLGDGTAFDFFAWLQDHHPAMIKRVAFITGDVTGEVPVESGDSRALSTLGCPVFGKPMDVGGVSRLLDSWTDRA